MVFITQAMWHERTGEIVDHNRSAQGEAGLPASETQIKRFGKHGNSFGFLRLILASAVIASHAPQLIDGNSKREVLYSLFGTAETGTLAVIYFFVISGYLITGSYLNSRSNTDYLIRRVARIYPAFLAAFWISILIFAPLGGGQLPGSPSTALKRFFDSMALQVPWVPSAFLGSRVPPLNGSLWTIAYEFRCYLLVLAMGAIGILQRRYIVLGLAALSIAATSIFVISDSMGAIPNPWGSMYLYYALGEPMRDLRLTAAFLFGSTVYLYRDSLAINCRLIVVATALFFCGLLSTSLVIATSIVFGGYLVFCIAGRATWMRSLNNKNDISYGVYLYAWPITKLIIYYDPKASPLFAGVLTLIFSIGFGWASWLLIEKPIMRLVRERLSRTRPVRAT